MQEIPEEKRKLMREQVGRDVFKFLTILQNRGLNEGSLREMGLKVYSKREELETLAQYGTIEDIMTSELIFRSKRPDDVFLREYLRRFDLIGLNPYQIQEMYKQEKSILESDGGLFQQQRENSWVNLYFLNEGINSLPPKDKLTLSELMLVLAEASPLFFTHPKFYSAINSIYPPEFDYRTEKLGFSMNQKKAYAKEECLLIKRLKEGRTEKNAYSQGAD